MKDLDPRWEWSEVRRLCDRESHYVRGRCNHLEVVPVESCGETVARLCRTCDKQLPAEWRGASLRPGLDEFDCGSYLDGRLTEHDVIRSAADGLHVDGAPAYHHDAIHGAGELCRDCSYRLAQGLGYSQPRTLSVSYQPGLPCEPEEVLVWPTTGPVSRIASYSYGRACFEPGEPRTAPCESCGTETLIDAETSTP